MILRQALMEGTKLLREAGINGPQRDARLLLAEVVDLPVARMTFAPDLPVSKAQLDQFQAFLARRVAREPVSRILERRQFWGRDFKVTPDVLDPRPETESLIAAALEGPAPDSLIDLGTGSGIIATTLLAEWPKATGLATDINPACLAVAKQNAQTHGVLDRLTLTPQIGMRRFRAALI